MFGTAQKHRGFSMFFLAFASSLIIPIFRALLILRINETCGCFARMFRDSVMCTSCIVRCVRELSCTKTQFQLYIVKYSSINFIEWQCHLGTIKKSIAAPILFSKNITMSVLGVLISGSQWAIVMLRWISKAFQCIGIFWPCILLRHLSQVKHCCQDFKLVPVRLMIPLCSAQREHRLQNHTGSDNALCYNLFCLAFLPK